jgi:hypothetical protein
MNDYRQKLLSSIGRNVSEDTISTMDWYLTSRYTSLTEEFIREFADKLDWTEISRKYEFCDKILIEFKNRILWDTYLIYRSVGFSILKEVILKSKFRSVYLIFPGPTTDEQKKEIQKILDLKYMFYKE